MAFSIQTNVNSLVAQENLRVNSNFQSQTIQRLTSGYRINSSSDDAAGLSIANKFRSDVTELTQGVRNANDGLSTLQIIDGGLNNISKMLDRMKTLATQSASSTFTGSRTTLNSEYGKLVNEIDRQAANIGLGGAGGTDAGRYVKSLGVYIGGSSNTQANGSVTVDLTAGRVDTTTLGLNTTSIAGTTPSTTIGAVNLNAANAMFLENTSQDFTIATASTEKTFTINGGSAGLSKEDFLTNLNNALSGTGVSAGVDATTGALTLSSDKGFAFNAVAAGVSAETAVTAGTYQKSTMNYAGGTISDYDSGTLQTDVRSFTINVNGTNLGSTPQLAASDMTKDQIFTMFKNAVSGSGLEVIRMGDDMYFQSDKSFTITTSFVAGDGTSTGGAQTGAGKLGNVAAHAAGGSAPSVSDVTIGAKDALNKISSALTSLGTVQGTVGSGQNMLSYAISLAQSQISNFSAAESRIRDADVASEAANLTKAQVLQQASIAAMAQANSAPQAVLSLLRG